MLSPNPIAAPMMRPWLAPSMLVGVSLLAAIVASAAPAQGGPVAALFPPWWSAAQTIRAAARAGPVIQLGAASFVAIVDSSDNAARTSLYRAGAWLLLNPLLATGCVGQPRPLLNDSGTHDGAQAPQSLP